MSNQPRIFTPLAQELSHLHQPHHLHQPEPAALFAGLHHVATQPLQLRAARVDRRPLGPQQHQPGHPQLRRLLHQPVEPLTLGAGRRQRQVDPRHMSLFHPGDKAQQNLSLAQLPHLSQTTSPVAIKQFDPFPRLHPAHFRQVVGFRPFQGEDPVLVQLRAIEAIRHGRNSPPHPFQINQADLTDKGVGQARMEPAGMPDSATTPDRRKAAEPAAAPRYVASPVHEAALQEMLGRLSEGERLLRLVGPPGVGKSALLSELIRRSRGPRRRICRLDAPPDGQAILSELVHALSPAGKPPPAHPAGLWGLLSERLRLLKLQSLSLICVVDGDEALAGDATLERLARLQTREGRGLGLICAGTQESATDRHDLWGAPVHLRELSCGELAGFLQRHFPLESPNGMPLDDAALARIHLHAGGNLRLAQRLLVWTIRSAQAQGGFAVRAECVDRAQTALGLEPATLSVGGPSARVRGV